MIFPVLIHTAIHHPNNLFESKIHALDLYGTHLRATWDPLIMDFWRGGSAAALSTLGKGETDDDNSRTNKTSQKLFNTPVCQD